MAEYDRVVTKIPELFSMLFVPHRETLDSSISPGLISLRWTSINLQAYTESMHQAITQFEQFIDRVQGIHEDRILNIFKVMLTTTLIDVPQHDAITVNDFVENATQLCQAASMSLENRSLVIENAVNELIGLLLPEDKSLPYETPEDLLEVGALTIKRKHEQREKLVQEADLLFQYFEQTNIDTLLHLIRSNLESLKKRVTIPSSITYSDHAQEDMKDHNPLFLSDIILSLPNLVTSPSLEEIQTAMNQVIQRVLAITKTIYCWGQYRPTMLPQSVLESHSLVRVRSKPKIVHQVSILKSKNYFHSVSEHKEIAKLVMSMGGAISSTKTIVKKTVEQFNKYEHLWSSDQDEYMSKFSEDNPGVTDYQQEMHTLTQLEADILVQPDTLTAGAVCLNTEQLKTMLVTEAKQWRVAYGRTMSHYYQTLLEKTFESIEEWGKSLSRPLNDFDEIRSVMATLKEVRENEITIDMSLGPIEVYSLQYILADYIFTFYYPGMLHLVAAVWYHGDSRRNRTSGHSEIPLAQSQSTNCKDCLRANTSARQFQNNSSGQCQRIQRRFRHFYNRL